MVIGILLMILQGVLWMLEGCVNSYTAKKKLNVSRIFAINAIAMVLLGLAIMPFREHLPNFHDAKVLLALLVLFLSGVLVYASGYLLYLGMKDGPNGIVWAFYQTAMIVPFLMAIMVHGEKPTLPRSLGTLALTMGMLAFGVGGDRKKGNADTTNAASKRRWVWLLPALLSMVVNGFSQYTQNAISHFPQETLGQLDYVTRSTSVYLGLLLGCIVHACFKPEFRQRPTTPETLLGILLGILCAIGYYFLLFKGLDALQAANASAIAFAIPVGVCVVSFTFYSVLALKERYSTLEWGGIIACSLGIVAITL